MTYLQFELVTMIDYILETFPVYIQVLIKCFNFTFVISIGVNL